MLFGTVPEAMLDPEAHYINSSKEVFKVFFLILKGGVYFGKNPQNVEQIIAFMS